ncbi:DUF805 domain-containing protein [Isoptericola jiangsuensis]|uniref:DUF805 domain-containing protein n=1 Tax=Isoptericola jiangsuensis TaxID=548579 RepID=UPI003AAD01B4
MGFGEAVTSVRTNLTTFTGRSRRSEFWWWYLFCALVGLGVGIVAGAISGIMAAIDVPALTWTVGVVLGLALLALWVYFFIATLSVAVRRLHDQDKSGLFLLLAFIPVVGAIVLLVFWLLEGTRGPNQYGADPRGAVAPGYPAGA